MSEEERADVLKKAKCLAFTYNGLGLLLGFIMIFFNARLGIVLLLSYPILGIIIMLISRRENFKN